MTHEDSPVRSKYAQSSIQLPSDWGPPIQDGSSWINQCENCGWWVRKTPVILPRGIDLPEGYRRDVLTQSASLGCVRCKLVLECWDKLGYDATLRLPGRHTSTEFASSQRPWELFVLSDDGHDPTYLGSRVCERLPTGDTSSEAAFRWATTQITTCDSGHACTKNFAPFRPTRLIDVRAFASNDLDVRLVISAEVQQELRLQYITLSHCWGEEIPGCLTTISNLEGRLTRIPWTLLSRTFQDAVTYTRRLGQRYLWIDSICIIQQDVEDWSRESTTMYDVYRNSYLTLASAWAPSGSGGLFATVKSPVPITNVVHPGVFTHLMLGRPRYNHLFESDPDYFHDNPLLTRGWVYQERMASRRILFFTRGELAWQCAEHFDCECRHFHEREVRDPARRALISSTAVTTENLPLDSSVVDKKEQWHRIVEMYSPLALTIDTDKLPAISALAKEVQDVRPREQYYAGLWSDSFQEDLLWHTTDLSKGGVVSRGGARSRRPIPIAAPTWSWASICDGVKFWNNGKLEFLFDVQEVACNTKHKNAFGQVEDASMTVIGRTVLDGQPLTTLFEAHENGSWRLISLPFLKTGLHCYHWAFYFDSHIDKHDDPIVAPVGYESVYLLAAARCSLGTRIWLDVNDAMLFFLLSKCSDGSYRRFGLFVLAGKHFQHEDVGLSEIIGELSEPRELVIT